MDSGGWNYLEELIATLVVLDALTLPKAIGVVCRNHPSEKADILLLAAISFATDLDNALGLVDEKALLLSHLRYRAIAALAADVALLSPTERTCNDLREFWRSTGSVVFR